MPLKPCQDPIKCFNEIKKELGIQVKRPSYGWLKREVFGLPNIQPERQVVSGEKHILAITKR